MGPGFEFFWLGLECRAGARAGAWVRVRAGAGAVVLGLGFRPGGRGVPRVNVSVTCSSSAPDLARLGLVAGG